MEGRVTVTSTDLLEALREALHAPTADPEGAYTADELAENTGLHVRKVRLILKSVLKKGEAEAVRVQRIAIDGRRAIVPAYRAKVAA